MPCKVWDETIYLFPNGHTGEVSEWISDFILDVVMDAIIYPHWDLN